MTLASLCWPAWLNLVAATFLSDRLSLLATGWRVGKSMDAID